MTMAELETAVRERAHVIAIVFDNGRYGTIWRHQEQRGGVAGLATKLGPIDFAAVANAAGALGLTVSTDAELEPALREALESGRPAVLHLTLDPTWTTPEAAAGEVLPQPVAPAESAPAATEAAEAVVEAVEAIEAALVAAVAEEALAEAVSEAVAEAIVIEAIVETGDSGPEAPAE
jgi:TPP-dependent trihydroxycyclohexane-1,2-dione (THcHDO) dehydratase